MSRRPGAQTPRSALRARLVAAPDPTDRPRSWPPSVVEIIADRVMVLYLGRVMEIAPTETLYRWPAHPYSAALLQAIPGARAGADRLVLKGEIPSPAAPPSGCVFRTRCPFALDDCARVVPELREVAPGQKKACIRDDLSF